MLYKNMKLNTLLLFIGLIAQAQQATLSSGGNFSGAGGNISYSIGQTDYISNFETTGTINQGVQQPYEIFLLGLKEEIINISLTVFPNPTSNYLTLLIKRINYKSLKYQLVDVQGKLIESDMIHSEETQIDMNNLNTGTYIIHILNKHEKIKSFKIIKN